MCRTVSSCCPTTKTNRQPPGHGWDRVFSSLPSTHHSSCGGTFGPWVGKERNPILATLGLPLAWVWKSPSPRVTVLGWATPGLRPTPRVPKDPEASLEIYPGPQGPRALTAIDSQPEPTIA